MTAGRPNDMPDLEELQRTVAIMKQQRARFGDSAVATVVDVLEERVSSFVSRDPDSLPRDNQADTEQRKQVTILFAAIDGFTRLAGLTPNMEQLRRIDRLWQRLDEKIEEFGGLVDKHMGDVVMGSFGVPVARENDPERAVNCALAIREVMAGFLAEEDLPERQPIVRIGINTGSVVLGRVGSDAGYTVIGDTVNVASRLRHAAAEGGVYISQYTYRLVEPFFRVEPLGDVKIKGRQAPVPAFRVLGQRPRPFFPNQESIAGIQVPLVGRDAQMRQLWTAYETIFRTRQGGVVTIVGEAGIGKSRLMGEFHRYLATVREEISVFLGRADQRQMHDPFSLLRDILAHRFEITESDRRHTVQEKLLAGLEPFMAGSAFSRSQMQEEIIAVARLLGFDLSKAAPIIPAGDMAVADRNRVFELLLSYFLADAERVAATVIFLEEVQWADDDSLDFVERVAALSGEKPFLVIAAARPQLFERRPYWPGDRGVASERLVLPPLSDAESRAWVLHVLQKLPAKTPAIVDLIVRTAGGNPFYLEELIKVLIEDGILLPGEPAWHMRPIEMWRLRAPATLTGVLQARLDRLPETERITLQQASVLGDEFWDKAVWQMNQASRWALSADQFDSALQKLERRDMVYRVPSPLFTGGQAFRFRHAMLREVAYESVLLRDRSGYHLQAARWFDAHSGDRLAEYAARIARHYELAEQLGAAARMLQLAAARAVDQNQTESAIAYYHHSLELLQHLPHELDVRLEIKSRLGWLLQRDGRFVEALQVFASMRQTAELDGNLLRQSQAFNALAMIFNELGDRDQALTAAEGAERVARLTDAGTELIRALRQRAEILTELGRFEEALPVALEAGERSRLFDDFREYAGSLKLLCLIDRRTNDPSEAERTLDQLTALAGSLEARGLVAEAGFTLVQLAALDALDNHYSEAQAKLTRALDLQRPVAGRSEIAKTLRDLGQVAGRGGDPARAIIYLEEAATLAEADGNRYLRLTCRLSMGEALVAGGRYDAAEAALRQTIAIAEDPQRMGRWRGLGEAYRLLAEALVRQGRRDEAAWVEEKARRGG